MFDFIARTLGGMLLTKSAREALATRAARKTAADGGRAAAVSTLQSEAKRLATPERVAMIQGAAQARSAKKIILDQLGDEKGARKVGDAIKRLLDEDRG